MQQIRVILHLLNVKIMPGKNSRYKNEAELIAACAKQRSDAQREVYEMLAPKMIAVCRRYVGDLELAKDVVQEGFVTLFDKIGSYKGEGSFDGWARRIFINTALMYIRKNDVLRYSEEIETVVPTTAASGNVIDNLQAADLMKLIGEMPTGFRMVFNLSVFEGCTHQEIAKILNISEGTSRSQLNRGRFWLQERIKKLDNKQ